MLIFIGEGNGTPLQYSWLENPMDGGAWWAAVHGVAKSRTRLSDFTLTFHFHALEKEMASTPVFLSGESQGWGSLVGCHLWGHRVGYDWSDLAVAVADLTSILAWRIPWTEEPGRPWGHKELDMTEQLLDDVWDLTNNSVVNPDVITFWVVMARR